MAKPKKSGGTFIERELFESEAFLALKGFAPQLLVLMLGKRQFAYLKVKGSTQRVCTNCDSINFTYVEAKNTYGINKSRLSRAIGELLAKGFMSIVHHGGGYKKDKSVYALVDLWRMWRPGMVFEKREISKVQRGFCKPKTETARENVPIHSHENVTIQFN